MFFPVKPGRGVTLFCALLLVSAIAAADLKSELQARYRQWDAAYRKHDLKAIGSMLASDFRIVTGSGKVISRKDYLKGLVTSAPPKVYRTLVLRTALQKGRALAWTEEVSQQADKRSVHRYRDIWVRRGKAWLLMESKTLEHK